MNRTRLVTGFALLLILGLSGDRGAQTTSSSVPFSITPTVFCWAEGEDPGHPPQFLGRWVETAGTQFQFVDEDRWSRTATDGPGLERGDPTTLTWGFPPDSTLLVFFFGPEPETLGTNNLIRSMDQMYGAGPGGEDLTQRPWFSVFEESIRWWSDASGTHYVYEPNDDGADMPGAPGVLGIRPDVRIGGFGIDGPLGILAFNPFPDIGDMFIDTDERASFLTPDDSFQFKNIIAHEHGHGLGLQHSCPEDRTKLMEPTAGFGFLGPQPDDILGANRGYGDPLEYPVQNNEVATASDIGSFAPGDSVTIPGLSIDGLADQDFISFTLPARMRVTLTMAPTGSTYWHGPQVCGDVACSCVGIEILRTLTTSDLSIELRGTDGTSILTFADFQPVGKEEVIESFLLPDPGSYYARVYSDVPMDKIQMYDFTLLVDGGSPPVAQCRNVTSCNGAISAQRVNSGSFDPDGDPFTMVLDPEGPYPPGESIVRFIVDDEVFADTCEATITVNQPPVVACQNVVVDSAGGAEVFPEDFDDGSLDPDGDDLSMALEPPGPYPLGVTDVLFIASDPCGASDTCSATVTVGQQVPVRLLSFGVERAGEAVVLEWTVGEVSDHAGFHVYREEPGNSRMRLTDVLLSGHDRYRFQDPEAPPARTGYWLEELSRTAQSSWHGPVFVAAATPSLAVQLSPAHPNPFASSTTIGFSLAETRPVRLTVHDLQGRRVRVLAEGTRGPGQHSETWDGRTDGGAQAASGLYLIRLAAGDKKQIRKIVLSR